MLALVLADDCVAGLVCNSHNICAVGKAVGAPCTTTGIPVLYAACNLQDMVSGSTRSFVANVALRIKAALARRLKTADAHAFSVRKHLHAPAQLLAASLSSSLSCQAGFISLS